MARIWFIYGDLAMTRLDGGAVVEEPKNGMVAATPMKF
jgi:hypothetical protein